MRPMEEQKGKEKHQRKAAGDPRPPRDRDRDRGHDNESGIADEDASQRTEAASDGIRQRQRQNHFKEAP